MNSDIAGRGSRKAYVVGTIDTKGEELRYIRDMISEAGIASILVDVGPRSQDVHCDVTSAEIAAYHPASSGAVAGDDRGSAIAAMAQAFTCFLSQQSDVGGVIGLGGSGGSAIVAPALQTLPIGTPKILVSTLASGDVSAYVGTSDIQMVNPVTDIAGLNRVSRVVLDGIGGKIYGSSERLIMDTFFLICFIITAVVFYRWTIVIAVLVTAGYVLLWIYCLVVVLVSMNHRAAESAPVASVVVAPTPTSAPRAELVVAPNAFDYVNKPGEKPRTAFDPTPTPAPLPDYAQKELEYMNAPFWKGN